MTENIASSAVASVGVKRPTLRFMLSHPAHVISLGFGSGLAPFAPGTFGTLVGLFAARWLQPMVGDTMFFLGLAVAFALSVWAAGVTGRALGESDHGSIVSDEVIAMALITAMLPGAAWKQLGGFSTLSFARHLETGAHRLGGSQCKGRIRRNA
jgi:phosphatidylglycerophosphatase A